MLSKFTFRECCLKEMSVPDQALCGSGSTSLFLDLTAPLQNPRFRKALLTPFPLLGQHTMDSKPCPTSEFRVRGLDVWGHFPPSNSTLSRRKWWFWDLTQSHDVPEAATFNKAISKLHCLKRALHSRNLGGGAVNTR